MKTFSENEFQTMLMAELTGIKKQLPLQESTLTLTDWIPRPLVMEFFDYGDTQIASLEKTNDLVVAKVGNVNFIIEAQ